MMMSFIERMRLTANNEFIVSETYRKERECAMAKRKHEMFTELTEKYYLYIKKAIVEASLHGKTTKYMNFFREDFKANFDGLGKPCEFQKMWLEELCNPDSSYIPIDPITNKKEHFEGLKFEVWNNRSFTTVFTWEE